MSHGDQRRGGSVIRRTPASPAVATPVVELVQPQIKYVSADLAEFAKEEFRKQGFIVIELPAPTQPKPAAVVEETTPQIILTPQLRGALHTASLGVRVAPVKAGDKWPPIKGFPELATTDENQIMAWANESRWMNCNWLALATPETVCFIDQDQTIVLRALYEARYGEPYPRTRTTQSREDHQQSCWLQTDRTRALGNKVQKDFKDGMMSFRQKHEYCLAQGSHLDANESANTGPRDYDVVDDSPIAVMPDKLMDLVESLLVSKDIKKKADVPRDENKKIPHGFIHDAIISQVGKLCRENYPPEMIEEAVFAWALENCAEPLDEDKIRRDVQENTKFPKGNPASEIVIVGQKSEPMSEGSSEIPADGSVTSENVMAEICGDPNKPFQLTHSQTSIAELTLRIFGHNIAFVTYEGKGKWMRFTGKIWVDVDRSRIRELIRKASQFVTNELIPAIEKGDGSKDYIEERVKSFKSVVGKCHDVVFVNKVLTWMEEHQIDATRFDQQDMKVNFNNGTFNFATGTFGDFDPADYSTQMMSINYNEKATCPVFDQMLANAFDNPATREYLLRFMGYCMLGTFSEKCFVLLTGWHDNGKTTLVEILSSILGNYAKNCSWDTFTVDKHGNIRNDIAGLHTARFVYCDEGAHDVQIAAETLKAFSGGGTMSCRFLRQEFFSFAVKFKTLLSTNFKPKLPVTDQALWNRVQNVDIKKHFGPDSPKRIEGLKNKLMKEREGIAAAMVRGAMDFLGGGLRPSDEVRVDTLSYRCQQDEVQEFLAACCVASPTAEGQTPKEDLRAAYNQWASENEKTPMNDQDFSSRLRNLDYRETKRHDPRSWAGIVLNAGAQATPPISIDSEVAHG